MALEVLDLVLGILELVLEVPRLLLPMLQCCRCITQTDNMNVIDFLGTVLVFNFLGTWQGY